MDDLENKFVMRGVPHTLGMALSLAPGAPFDGTTTPPNERTGWSGDGAPSNGTLREFAIGAVTQHFPLTTNRVPGVDFQLPSDEDLDKLEAFQLFLGRDTELDQVVAVAAFLRVINALENIRSADETVNFVLLVANNSVARSLLTLALAEVEDGIEVLDCGGLHPGAQQALNAAAEILFEASRQNNPADRNFLIGEGLDALQKAVDDMVT